VNDTSFCILLVAMPVWGLKGRIIVVETAFLYGDLEEEIYMEIPSGREADADECVILEKTTKCADGATFGAYKELE